jgi:gluconokinase
VEAALAEMEPDEHGLTMLPFLSGERSPGWAGDARATFHGISVATTPLEMLRAGLESVAYRVGLVLDLLRPQLPRDFEVVVSGAALTASPTWLRIVADVLGRPLVVSPVEEASARGAALLALKALGVDVEAEAVASPPRVVPDAARGAVYRAAMERQGALYRRLIANHEA